MNSLACGPYFNGIGIVGSLLLLLVGKPLVYWLFILCFRYRVSTPEPMSMATAKMIAGTRAAIGLLAAVGTYLLLIVLFEQLGPVSAGMFVWWLVVLVERAIVWYVLGARSAKLTGRRLLGWTLSGVGIDLAFDLTVYAASFSNPAAIVLLGLALAMFLSPLYRIGRRPSLKARFLAKVMCRKCGYDLSGIGDRPCPECGTSQHAAPRPT